jgi:hypothetical protein
MTKTKYDTELISEGCRSYHKALFAVMQFRKQVQEAIADAVAGDAGALAAALGLDESKLECDDYAIPAHYQTAFDGSEAEVGLSASTRIGRFTPTCGWGTTRSNIVHSSARSFGSRTPAPQSRE